MNRIGIVIPLLWRDVRYLGETVASIDHKLVNEVVIVADWKAHNADDGDEILFLKFHINKVIRHACTRGPAAARNAGIRHCLENGAEAVICLDADDLLAHGWLADMAVANLDSFDIVTGFCRQFGPGMPPADFRPQGKFSPDKNDACLSSSTLIHRRVFEGGFRTFNSDGLWYDESMTNGLEDWHFFNEAVLTGFRIDVRDQLALHYRIKPDCERHTTNSLRHKAEIKSYMRGIYRDKYGCYT